jgi:SNF2 family DNA or RNA helicase
LSAELVIRNSSEGGAGEVSITSAAGGQKFELEVGDLERGHTVLDGIWYPIDPDAAAEMLGLLRGAGMTLGPIHSLRALLSLRRAAMDGSAVNDCLTNSLISPLAFGSLQGNVPNGIDGVLYPYQLTGWRWLKFLLAEGVGGLLADEMGLGKTLQIISVLSDTGGAPIRPALVVAPGSLLENWRRELGKYAPGLKVLKHHGASRTGRPSDLQDFDVVVTSYDSAVRDNSLLNMIEWGVVVLDEAQFIRNPNAQRTRAVKHLRRRAGLAVTGTPVENRLLDLWSIIDFVLPGHLGDEKSFATNFVEDEDGAARVEPLVSPLMLRRRIAEVAQDLPPRIDILQVLELEDDEAALYDLELERINREYEAVASLVALTSLRRFCAHPSLMRHHGGSRSDPMSFSKFRRLDEILGEIFSRNEKVVIFTSFTAMADMISGHIAETHRCFTGIIDGRLAVDDRQPLIDEFSEVRGTGALILNPRAGGAGLNITAANHVIHYNPEWNPALEDQASARVHRRGQELPVTIHRLVLADTVEDIVSSRLARKRALSSTAVLGVEGTIDDYGDIIAALSCSPSRRFGR